MRTREWRKYMRGNPGSAAVWGGSQWCSCDDSAVAQDDDEQQVVLLMDRLESNLSTEMRSWSKYDYEILVRVLTPVQVTGCAPAACSNCTEERRHRPVRKTDVALRRRSACRQPGRGGPSGPSRCVRLRRAPCTSAARTQNTVTRSPWSMQSMNWSRDTSHVL